MAALVQPSCAVSTGMQGSDVQNSQFNGGLNDVRFFATLAYDGKGYDHIQFKNRGKGSTYVSGKTKCGL